MQAYYNILDKIKAELLADLFVNTVSQGDIFDVDLAKQTIFPLSHIMVNSATRNGNIYTFSMSVLLMDIVDVNPAEATDKFRGNDNETDVLNTQLAVGARLVEMLDRGDIRNDNYALSGTPQFEPFTERFESYLAGWSLNFDIDIPNDMTIC